MYPEDYASVEEFAKDCPMDKRENDLCRAGVPAEAVLERRIALLNAPDKATLQETLENHKKPDLAYYGSWGFTTIAAFRAGRNVEDSADPKYAEMFMKQEDEVLSTIREAYEAVEYINDPSNYHLYEVESYSSNYSDDGDYIPSSCGEANLDDKCELCAAERSFQKFIWKLNALTPGKSKFTTGYANGLISIEDIPLGAESYFKIGGFNGAPISGFMVELVEKVDAGDETFLTRWAMTNIDNLPWDAPANVTREFNVSLPHGTILTASYKHA